MPFKLFDRYLGMGGGPKKPLLAPVRQAEDIDAAGERAAVQVARLVHEMAEEERREGAADWRQSSVRVHLRTDDLVDLAHPFVRGLLREAARELARGVPSGVVTTFSVHHGFNGPCALHEYTVWLHRAR